MEVETLTTTKISGPTLKHLQEDSRALGLLQYRMLSAWARGWRMLSVDAQTAAIRDEPCPANHFNAARGFTCPNPLASAARLTNDAASLTCALQVALSDNRLDDVERAQLLGIARKLCDGVDCLAVGIRDTVAA